MSVSQLPAPAARDGTALRGELGERTPRGQRGVGEVTVQFVAWGLPAAIVDTDAHSPHRPPRTTRLAHGPHLLSSGAPAASPTMDRGDPSQGVQPAWKPPADEPFALAGTYSPRDLGLSAGCAHPGTRRTWWSRISWPRQCWRRPLLVEVRLLVGDAGARVTPRGSDRHLPGGAGQPGHEVPCLAPWARGTSSAGARGWCSASP